MKNWKKVLEKSKSLLLLVIGIIVSVGILGFFYNYSQKSQASSPPAYFSFGENTLQTVQYESKPVHIWVRTDGKKMSIGTILVKIPSVVEFDEQRTRDGQGGCEALENLIDVRVITHADGKVLVLTRASMKSDAELPSGAFCFARIYLKGKTPGSDTLNYVQAGTAINEWRWDLAGPSGEFEAKLEDGIQGVTINVSTPSSPTDPTATIPPNSPNATSTPVPAEATIAPVVRQEVPVNLRLRFQGINAQPRNSNPIAVSVKLVEGNNGASEAQSVVFTPQGDGAYVANHTFRNVNISDNHSLLIKGPKHIQKRICVNSPSENIPGTYKCDNSQITLKASGNSLDFTNIILLSGDIPLQNGIVDAVDIAYIRNNIGESAPEVVARGDLNYDGILDSQDYTLIIGALNFKYDE